MCRSAVPSCNQTWRGGSRHCAHTVRKHARTPATVRRRFEVVALVLHAASHAYASSPVPRHQVACSPASGAAECLRKLASNGVKPGWQAAGGAPVRPFVRPAQRVALTKSARSSRALERALAHNQTPCDLCDPGCDFALPRCLLGAVPCMPHSLRTGLHVHVHVPSCLDAAHCILSVRSWVRCTAVDVVQA